MENVQERTQTVRTMTSNLRTVLPIKKILTISPGYSYFSSKKARDYCIQLCLLY